MIHTYVYVFGTEKDFQKDSSENGIADDVKPVKLCPYKFLS